MDAYADADPADEIDKAEPPLNGEKLREQGEKWLQRIRKQIELEKPWRDEAMTATAAYAGEAEAGKRYAFNILYSNVETIVPAIYNSTPSPDVRRRFGDKDPIAKTVADVLQRGIALQLDNGAMDSEIEAMAQDAFVAGRGIVRLRVQQEPTRIEYEVVPWRDYVEGPAKRWRDVPWVAFRQSLQKEDVSGITATGYIEAQSNYGERLEGEVADDVVVWEVWCAKTRCVYFIRDRDGLMLSKKEDPLGLKGFFCCPEPTQPISVTGRRMPVNPFSVYRELAEELDVLTKRINKIVSGIKARGGFVAGEAGADLQELATADDNTLTEIKGVEMATQAGGLDKLIAWWPIEQAAAVVTQLSAQREQVKQAIYEITGISDIVRGASKAQETASAQQIKSQWGSLRIKKMQRQIEATVRDLFQMSADIIARMFDPGELSQMTGIELTPEHAALMQKPVLMLYRVDVESDSTVRADVSRNQGEMNTFLQGTAQFIQAVGPAVQSGMMPKETVLEIYTSFARSFKLGKQAEDALEALQERVSKEAQAQQGPTPEQLAAEKEKAAKELELQKREAMLPVEEAKVALANERLQFEAERLTTGIGQREKELAMKGERMALDQQTSVANTEIETGRADVDALRAEMAPVLAQIQAFAETVQMMQQQASQRDASLIAAITAPKQVTLPDGRVITSQTAPTDMMVN